MLLRKIHRDALEYVNSQLINEGRTPIDDIPTGLRWDDEHSPIGKLLPGFWDQLDEDDWTCLMKVISGGAAESAILWSGLFYFGFYREYNEARLYERIPPRKAVRLLRSMRNAPDEVRERYYRARQLAQYVRRELPSRT